MHDIKLALRALARRPGFTFIALLTLALGIGANAAIFSVVDSVLLRQLPFADADRLVIPWAFSADVQKRVGFDRLPSSPGDVTDFIARNSTFEDLASMRAERVNITGNGEPERVGGVRVSGNFLRTLGVQPVHGRDFVTADAAGGRAVLIGYGLWQRRFALADDVTARPLSVNGEPATIVGVMPPWFRFPSAGEMPTPLGLAQTPEIWSLDTLTPEQQRTRGGKSFAMIGRLRDGVGIQAAQADLASIAADIARDFPASNAGWTVRVMPLREQLVGSVRSALVVLLAAVGCVLLIACVNVANLLLVRAASRQREVAVRYALGAERHQILRQLLLESLVLSLTAGAVGVLIGWWGLRALLAMLPVDLPSVAGATLDWRVVAFTTVLSVITGMVFGAVPAYQAARVDLVDGLREGARGTVGSRRAHRTRNALVVVEVALAAVLLICASLLIQTFVRLLQVNTGFRADGVLTMEVALPRSAYAGPRAAQFFESLVARLSALPGVDSAAAASAIPLSGSENLRQITIEGRPQPDPGKEIIADFRVITADYFATMGIPRIAGEPLPRQPQADSSPVLLINSMMAETHFGGENPIGRRMKLTAFTQDSPWFTIVGVVGDTRHTALDSALRPQVYVHQNTEPSLQMVVVLRARDDPEGYASVARAAVHELDANQPAGRIRTMRTVVYDAVGRQRFTMFLAGTFAGLALLLSLVGLYAVVSYSVAERTHELGLRFALGASPARLLALVLADGMKLVGVGVVLGVLGALAMARFIQTQLFGVTAYDARTFIAVSLMLFCAAIAGCLIPARRATRIDPMTALRAD
ncbi:MAG TPA: ABC transporter permease [Vicinamibacterales bacterium]|nr:ABC transporter permease [Vicinamibacterales bacterium]